jgi:hypothetical protein
MLLLDRVYLYLQFLLLVRLVFQVDLWVHKDRLVLQAQWDLKALPAQQVQQDQMVLLAFQVPQVHKDQRDLQDHKAQQDQLEDQQALKVHKDLLVLQVLLVPKAQRALLVHKDHLA